MLRKYALFWAAGLALLFVAALAWITWRPVTIHIDQKTQTIRGAGLTTAQALYAAGADLDPADRVEPGLQKMIPLDGQIHIQRAVQVTLWDSGQTRQITGLETTPKALLQQAGVTLQDKDRLLWNGSPLALDSTLPAGKPLVIQIVRAKSIVLDHNDQRQVLASTAPTLAGALWDAGVRLGPGDLLSADPGSAVQDKAVIAYQPAREVMIEAGGQEIRAHTTAKNVGQVLASAGVALQGLDYSVPAEDQPLPPAGRIRVVRVHEEISLKETLIPYEQELTYDANVALDQRQVVQPGQFGVKVERERAKFEDGKEIQRAVDSDWVASQPVAETVGIGTKVVPLALDVPGGKIEYWRAVNVYATSYSPCDSSKGCSWSTSSGIRLRKGIIAVTLSWYRIISGLRVYVPGYGEGIIADVGGGIPGTPWIDLGFDENSISTQAFNGWTTLYFLTPAPANVTWNLP